MPVQGPPEWTGKCREALGSAGLVQPPEIRGNSLTNQGNKSGDHFQQVFRGPSFPYFFFLTDSRSSKSTQDCAWESRRLQHMIQWIPIQRSILSLLHSYSQEFVGGPMAEPMHRALHIWTFSMKVCSPFRNTVIDITVDQGLNTRCKICHCLQAGAFATTNMTGSHGGQEWPVHTQEVRCVNTKHRQALTGPPKPNKSEHKSGANWGNRAAIGGWGLLCVGCSAKAAPCPLDR